jgi:hypothetical protein
LLLFVDTNTVDAFQFWAQNQEVKFKARLCNMIVSLQFISFSQPEHELEIHIFLLLRTSVFIIRRILLFVRSCLTTVVESGTSLLSEVPP